MYSVVLYVSMGACFLEAALVIHYTASDSKFVLRVVDILPKQTRPRSHLSEELLNLRALQDLAGGRQRKGFHSLREPLFYVLDFQLSMQSLRQIVQPCGRYDGRIGDRHFP